VKVAGITDEQVVAYTWTDNSVSWTVSSSQQKAQDGKYTLVLRGDATLVKFELLAEPECAITGLRAQTRRAGDDRFRDQGVARAGAGSAEG